VKVRETLFVNNEEITVKDTLELDFDFYKKVFVTSGVHVNTIKNLNNFSSICEVIYEIPLSFIPLD
jgi:hypothetical protein